MGAPVVSVIIPCRGHAEQLQRCLAALQQQQQSPPFEIIVVDSAADPAVAAAAAAFPKVRVISDTTGLYPGGARNRGVDAARSDYLAFVDADCVPEPAWLATGYAALQLGATVVGGAVLDLRPWHPIAASDNLLQFSDFLPQRPDGPASHIPTCNFAIRRARFLELGGFASDLPLCEDGLFSAAAAARWPGGIRFVRAMRVRHAGRATLAAFWAHQRAFGFHRGRVGSRLRHAAYQRWGRWRIIAVPVICVRLGHVLRRTAQWHPVGLLRIALLLPLLMIGLTAWAGAFRQGCLEAARAS